MKRSQFFAALTMVSLLITLIAKGQYTGVGTTSPQSRFHLNGTAWFQGDNTPLSPNAGAGIGIGFPAGGTGGYIYAWSYANNTPRNLWLNHTGGSVFIGSTSSFPNARLEIAGNGARAIYSSTNSSEALYGYSTGGTGVGGEVQQPWVYMLYPTREQVRASLPTENLSVPRRMHPGLTLTGRQ